LTLDTGRTYRVPALRARIIPITAGRRSTCVTGLVLALVVASVAACGSDGEPGDGRLRVLASFYPLAEAAEVVGGSLVDVDNLTPPGVEPHDLELTPDDLEALATADVVIYASGGFQPAVEDGLDDAEGALVDATEAVPTLPAGDGDGPVADPHVWLDPARFAVVVGAVAEALAELDPADAAAFRSNADAYRADLSALDGAFADGLETCDRRTMVVNHAAFAYLADAYDLEQVAISGASPESETDPARLAELRALVQDEGVTTIFTEALASPEVAETLAEEAGVAVAVLDPLEGLTTEQIDAGEDYVSVMRRNLETLRTGLGCA
jgi:zinc transport system substrate-binding protein